MAGLLRGSDLRLRLAGGWLSVWLGADGGGRVSAAHESKGFRRPVLSLRARRWEGRSLAKAPRRSLPDVRRAGGWHARGVAAALAAAAARAGGERVRQPPVPTPLAGAAITRTRRAA